jgi:MFS transporter, UMF1 family
MKDLSKNDKRTLRAWALFDTANSAHALVIAAAIFPAYYLKVTDEWISVMGFEVKNSSMYAFAISFSYLLLALISPLLSGMADYGHKRKMFLRIFTYLGSFACLGLFFFDGMDHYWTGIGSYILSLIGFAGGLVFYNSYLPIIATEDRFNALSARGFAYGYAGSVLLLLLILAGIMNPEAIGLADAGAASRLGFALVGVWWVGIASITFYYLPPDHPGRINPRVFRMGYLKVLQVFGKLRRTKVTRRFLMAFFLYSMGVQTVLLLAATFAESEMEFGTTELISLILIIQLVAIAGSYLFAWISKLAGNKTGLMLQLGIWLLICIAAFFIKDKISFYLLAGLVGMVFGGIQSLSRATYAMLVADQTRSATSFFSFYDVLEKAAIVLGTFAFGLVAEWTGSMRNSTLVLAVFFLLGLAMLGTVSLKRKIHGQNK